MLPHISQKYIPYPIEVSKLQRNVKEEDLKSVLKNLEPLIENLVSILCSLEYPDYLFCCQEKRRLEKYLGNTLPILPYPEDIEQDLYLELIKLYRSYVPKAFFSVYITKNLRWYIVKKLHQYIKSLNLEEFLVTKQDSYLTFPHLRHQFYSLKLYNTLLCAKLMNGYSIRKLANELGLSKSQIHRDLQKLKKEF